VDTFTALVVQHLLEAQTALLKLALQGARMKRQLGGYGLKAAMSRGKQPDDQLRNLLLFAQIGSRDRGPRAVFAGQPLRRAAQRGVERNVEAGLAGAHGHGAAVAATAGNDPGFGTALGGCALGHQIF
jgi:hypothetical protein